MTNLDSILKSRDMTWPTKVHVLKAMVFPVVMYRCESWTVRKAECQRIDAFELWCWRRLESPLDSKEIQRLNPKENQSWIFIGRTDAEAEIPIIWQPDAKKWLIEKDLMLGKIEGRSRKGWQRMRWLDGITDPRRHEFEQALGVGGGQRSLVCYSPWGHEESGTIEQLNWLNQIFQGKKRGLYIN